MSAGASDLHLPCLMCSCRYNSVLAKRLEELGGIKYIFLTHRCVGEAVHPHVHWQYQRHNTLKAVCWRVNGRRDDVGDHAKWAKHFNAVRILHKGEVRVWLSVHAAACTSSNASHGSTPFAAMVRVNPAGLDTWSFIKPAGLSCGCRCGATLRMWRFSWRGAAPGSGASTSWRIHSTTIPALLMNSSSKASA